jgi:hypothetical protein
VASMDATVTRSRTLRNHPIKATEKGVADPPGKSPPPGLHHPADKRAKNGLPRPGVRPYRDFRNPGNSGQFPEAGGISATLRFPPLPWRPSTATGGLGCAPSRPGWPRSLGHRPGCLREKASVGVADLAQSGPSEAAGTTTRSPSTITHQPRDPGRQRRPDGRTGRPRKPSRGPRATAHPRADGSPERGRPNNAMPEKGREAPPAPSRRPRRTTLHAWRREVASRRGASPAPPPPT